MTKRHYTSDIHGMHKLVAVERMLKRWNASRLENGEDPIRKEDLTDEQGASMIDEHSAVIAENWDRVVAKDDIVYILGDIAMNPRKGVFDWIKARPGRKILVFGNHDEAAGFRSKGLTERTKPEWTETFVSSGDFAFIKIGGKRVALSHYPYDGEGDRDFEGGDRYEEARLRDMGVPLIHGHEHSVAKAHTSRLGTPMFHVGLDAWNLELVPESVIVEWLDNLPTTPPAPVEVSENNRALDLIKTLYQEG